MTDQQDLGAIARAIIDANLYMTLGTADAAGRPWVSPVYYAANGYREFYWISSPEVTHSRNLARRPQVSMVVFDSQVAAGMGEAVYMSAIAAELTGTDLDQGVEVYPGPARRGGRRMTSEQLRAPAAYRLYRATVSQHSMLCPRTGPCAVHGRAFDHRTAVTV
jgi:pyridoxamine 5'-phosphate oxidase-like protein